MENECQLLASRTMQTLPRVTCLPARGHQLPLFPSTLDINLAFNAPLGSPRMQCTLKYFTPGYSVSDR